MKASTGIRHARVLRRITEGATLADIVPDHVPDFDRVLVRDLPRLTIAIIGASYQADKLATWLREWIDETMYPS